MNAPSIEFIKELRQPYQIMRSSKSSHIINDSITMNIETFIRIYDNHTKDERTHIIFYVVGGNSIGKTTTEITSGEVFELLKEKYFKPEMVKW